jgi:hypothetical protein
VIAVIGTSAAIITPGVASAADWPWSSSATSQPRQVGGLYVLPNGKIVPPPAPPPPPAPSLAVQAQQAGAQQAGDFYVLPNGMIWTPPTPGYTTVGGLPVGTAFFVRVSGYLPVPLGPLPPGLGGNLSYTADPTGQTGGYANIAVGFGVGGGFVMAYLPPGSPFFGLQSRLVDGPLTVFGSADLLSNTVAASAFLDVVTKGAFAVGPGGIVTGPLDPGAPGAPSWQFAGAGVGGGVSFGAEMSLNLGVTFPLPAWLPAAVQSWWQSYQQMVSPVGNPVVGSDGLVHIPADLPILGEPLAPGTTFTVGGYKYIVDPPPGQSPTPPTQDPAPQPGNDGTGQSSPSDAAPQGGGNHAAAGRWRHAAAGRWRHAAAGRKRLPGHRGRPCHGCGGIGRTSSGRGSC